MKISNEVKIGVLAIVAIVVLVFGFNFLKGNQVFSKPPTLYAKFPAIGTLEKSNQVKINGLAIGTVHEIRQADAEVDTIMVVIHLDKDVRIPKNSVAFIDGSVLGSAYINISKPANPTTTYLQSGDTISTRLDQGLLGNIQQQLSPTLTRVNQTLDTLRVAIGGIASIFDPGTKSNLQSLVSNLSTTSGQLSQLMGAQTSVLQQSLGNLNSLTGNLAKSNDAITSSIRNVEVTTSKLANANIEGVVAALQATINELKGTVANLNNTNGTLGLLTQDRKLYDELQGSTANLKKTMLSAEILLDDIRLHPKRYLNFSVFGGRNKGEPITSPSAKDTIPVPLK